MMNSWMGRTCIAVLVAAVISGCGGAEQTPNDRQTPPIRPSTESPSLTPTPTADEILTEPEREYPEPPVRPAEMARDDVDGAVAAAEYFLMLYPYVYATGDLGEWEAMSHPDCKFCGSVLENVERIHSGGGYVVDESIELEVIRTLTPATDSGRVGVDLLMSSKESAEYNVDDAVVTAWPAGDNLVMLDLSYEGARWRVIEVAIEEMESDEEN